MKPGVAGVVVVSSIVMVVALTLSRGNDLGTVLLVFGVPNVILGFIFYFVDTERADSRSSVSVAEIHNHYYPHQESITLTQIEEYRERQISSVTRKIESKW